jgi:catechol 2,3-dioxygenase-like lactoylglutathione lyase family enzyme
MSEPRRPVRLHHNAYVSTDLERTRKFYEDVVGLPLVATWCESDELFGEVRTYCHCFFELADKSALAFFQFAGARDQALFGPALTPSPFRHIALMVDAETQAAVEKRAKDAGLEGSYVLEHGYCRSLYLTDPDGLIVELTHDAPSAIATEAVEHKKRTAHDELARWLAGDHTSNNTYR